MGIKERKEREREQRRHDILASARTAFEKHGLDHASMDKIAEEAELAKGTLYLYYQSRDELLMALIAEDLEDLIARMDKVAKGRGRADNKLIKTLETFHGFAEENTFFYRVMTQVNVGELMKCGDEESPALEHFQELNTNMMQTLAGILQQGVNDEMFFLEHSVEQTVLHLVLCIKGTLVILNNNMVPPEWAQFDVGTILKEQVELFIRGLKSPLEGKQRVAARQVKKASTSKSA